LEWAVTAGQQIQQGETIARLKNVDLQRQLSDVQRQLDLQNWQVQMLHRRRISDAAAGAELPAAMELLAAMEAELVEFQRRQDQLKLVAPRSGTVLPPRYRPNEAGAGELDSWTGTPLDPENLGSYLAADSTICEIIDANSWDVLMILDQNDVGLAHAGQQVHVQLQSWPGQWLSGRIEEIARVDVDQLPPELIARRTFALDPREQGKPQRSSYQARVRLEQSDGPVLSGMTGRVAISGKKEPLGWQLWRSLSRTLQFQL
jgi:putative peptide zinc metalloprotease protein